MEHALIRDRDDRARERSAVIRTPGEAEVVRRLRRTSHDVEHVRLYTDVLWTTSGPFSLSPRKAAYNDGGVDFVRCRVGDERREADDGADVDGSSEGDVVEGEETHWSVSEQRSVRIRQLCLVRVHVRRPDVQ